MRRKNKKIAMRGNWVLFLSHLIIPEDSLLLQDDWNIICMIFCKKPKNVEPNCERKNVKPNC